MSVTISNPSITHTFGNVACVAADYVQSFFPENYFTKVHISTKMAHRQLDAFRAKSGFWKNKKPMLVLRPRVDFDDSSKWYYGSTMMSRVTHRNSPMEFADLVPFLHDPEHGMGVHFLWNRYRIIYDVVIITDTMNKQLNIMNDLRNRMNIEFPYYLKTTLESYIPKSVIHEVNEQLGIPEENLAQVLDYWNTYSATPVTYKLKNGSGNNEFFMMYPTSIETIATDLTPDDGETRGIISDTFTISFSLSMEFNGVGVWYSFRGDNKEEKKMAPIDEELGPNDRLVLVSSIPLNQDLRLPHGWKIYASPFYYVDSDDDIDETDIKSILESGSIQSLIKHHKKYNIPLEPYLQFRCFKGSTEIPRGIKGFDIDIEKGVVYTYFPELNTPYRLFVLINMLELNNMSSEIANFNKNI